MERLFGSINTELLASLPGHLASGDRHPEPVLNLRPCPYGSIASDDPEVVCQLHLGLMRGILGPDQPWEVVSVEPWAGPTTCRVTLLQHSPSATGGDDLADA